MKNMFAPKIMKKILSSLSILAVLALFSTDIYAQNNKNKGNSRKVDITRITENTSGKTTYRMSSETTVSLPASKFVINGRVAADIPDSCYNIYITDVDQEIKSSDLVACVPVKNKQFRFETDIATMQSGRIRAIIPGGKLCSAWINIYFIPGFTVDLTVHDGYYDIHNEPEYKFMVNAWLNNRPLGILCNSLGISNISATGTDNLRLETALDSYQDLLEQLRMTLKQIQNTPMNYETREKEYNRIFNQMEKINIKMQELIDKYASTIE